MSEPLLSLPILMDRLLCFNYTVFFRPVYNYDDLVEGKPRMCKIR